MSSSLTSSFIPTEDHLKDPVAQWYMNYYAGLRTTSPNLLHTTAPPTSNKLPSASNWTDEQLCELKVVPLIGLSVGHLFPSEFLPGDDDVVFQEVISEITAVTFQDLKAYSFLPSPFEGNRFDAFFARLSEVITTKATEDDIFIQGSSPTTSDTSHSSDTSNPSDEDKAEPASEQACQEFIRCLIKFDPLKKIFNSVRFVVQCIHMTLPFCIGQYTSSAENDGGVYLSARNPKTRSQTYGKVPLFSFEAKRRHAGGIVRHTAAGERYNERLVAQELAEMIGQVYAHDHYLQSPVRAREAFVLSMHGTQLYLACVHFSDDYMACIRHNTALADDRYLYYRRSEPFDMKYENQRVEAVRMVLGFLRYLKSGRAEIGTLKRLFSMG